MAYATAEDVAAGFRTLTTEEITKAGRLIEEAAVIIDAYAPHAEPDAKRVVTCNMVRRALTAGEGIPLGATQGTVSAGGYSQSWTASSGTGELYIGKLDKKLLGVSNKVGIASPYESGAAI